MVDPHCHAGARCDAAATRYEVADTQEGAAAEGTDTLSNIENPQFGGSDGTNVAIASDVNNICRHTSVEMDLMGDDGSNTIEGGGGSDVITGGVEDDTIHGFLVMPGTATEAEADSDTATYAGNRDGFTATATLATTNGVVAEVTETDTGNTGEGEADEGTAMLTSIERLRFNSGGAKPERVNVGLVFGGKMANGTLNGTSNHDIIFCLAGNDSITGMGDGDTIDGGERMDIAVLGGAVSDYHVPATLDGTNVGFAVPGTRENGGDGIDTPVGIEMVRFLAGDDDDETLNVVTTGTDMAEILVETDMANGTAATPFLGMGGGKLIFVFGGDSHLEGGAEDDKIDGCDGMDATCHAGARADYLIRLTGTGAVQVTHAADKDGMTNGDLGRDEPRRGEMIGFGITADTAISGLMFDRGCPACGTDGGTCFGFGSVSIQISNRGFYTSEAYWDRFVPRLNSYLLNHGERR